ncbi:recombinase family protein [Streptomyces sp. NPDC055085]
MTRRYILDSYARESVDSRKRKKRDATQRSLSIAGQHEVNLSRIKEYGADPGLLLEDPGKSAWDPKVKRRDWERLLARVEKKESDGVVIFDIERFLRRMEDAVRIVKMAERGFLVIDSDGEYNLTTPQGQKNFYEAAVSAQYYSHRLSTRVKRGYSLKIADGEWIGGRYRMFGFETDATTVRPAEAKIVAEAARRLLLGSPPKSVVKWLSETVGVTPAGAAWSASTLRKLLINPRLAGHISRNGQIVGRLKSQPILDPTMWQAVVTYYAARSGRPATGAFLCSGIVVHDDCGHTINGELQPKGSGKDFRRYPDGKRAGRYFCPGSQGGCGKTIGDVRALDRHIKSLVIGELMDANNARRLQDRVDADSQTRAPIEAELARLNALKLHWGRSLNSGKIDLPYHDAMVGDLDTKIVSQQAELEALGVAPEVPYEDFLADAEATWEVADGIERRELLKRAYIGNRILVVGGPVRDVDFTQRLRVEPVA